jgi:hypothetical protein
MARAANIDTAGWTWSAVAAGVIASLIVQVILVMLGFGLGLVGADVLSTTTQAMWLAFAWWTFSGIFAAAVGGWVAGMFSPTRDEGLKGVGGLTAWAIAALIVVGISGLAAGAGTTVAGALAGPAMTASMSYQDARGATSPRQRESVGQAMPSGTAEQAKKQLSIAMLVSAVALLLGAMAAYFAACAAPTRRAAEAD